MRRRPQAPEPQQLLATKFAPPRLRVDLVPRPRLFAALDRGIERKLTLISTGPGYGKSTLAADWLTTSRLPAAWLSLDERDNDAHTFFRYLTAALQTIDAELCPELTRMLGSGRVPAVRTLVSTLINELAVVTRPFVLILDDFHAIDSPEILEGFALLVQNLPHMMRLLVTTRTDPALPLLRMQARGELVELRAEDLSFTLDETRALLAGHYQLQLGDAELRDVLEWADGWPVGLMLVGQRMQGQAPEERQALMERLAGDVRFVEDYLWQESLEQQSPERRQFLLQTSLLDRFDAELCSEVTGLPAGAMLKQIERDNLFLIGLDGAGKWFRYHHLFVDVLRARLAQDSTADEVRTLHRRAAAWYFEHGTAEEAARHALAAQDWDRALPLLVEICTELNRQERISSLRQWLDRLPLEVLKREPRLCVWWAWAMVRHGRVPEALQLLESAEREWTPGQQSLVLGTILQIRMMQATYHQHADHGLELSVQALAAIDARQPTERSRTLLWTALLHQMRGDVASAEIYLSEMRALAPAHTSQALRLMERNATAGNLMMRARLPDAAEQLRQVIALGDEWNDFVVQYAHWLLASIHLEWNELDDAERLVRNGYQITQKTSAPLLRGPFHQYLSEIAWVRGDHARAYQELDWATEATNVVGGEGELRHIDARRTRFWMASNALDAARAWARETGLDPSIEPDSARYFEYITLLQLMVIEGRAERVLVSIALSQPAIERDGRNDDLLHLLLLRATAEHAMSDERAAVRSLQNAMEIGAPGRYARSFLDYGARLAPVLNAVAQARGDHEPYARSLLKQMGLGDEPAYGAVTLSPREIEVLCLIAAGDSNRQIGDRLFISEQTVKKHVSNIFEKLSVASRTQAIDRGRRLGIL